MVQSLTELPLVLSVRQVQYVLGICKTTAYELVHTGAIESVSIGRTFRVTRAALAKFLGLADEAPTTLPALGEEVDLEG
jgi:excisionase family DNA binding protein